MKKIFFIVLLSPLFMATTCDNEDVYCTEELRAGITVSITLEDVTGILPDDLTVIATDGEYSEELMPIEASDFNFSGVYERAGTYIITVSKVGYQTYISNEIIVNEDECHVITVHVDVQLEK